MKNFYLSLFFLSICTPLISQNIDIEVLKRINLNRNKNLDETFRTISNSIIPVSVGIPIGVFCAGYIKHDSTLKNKGIYIGATFLVAAGISTGLKYSINRPRPFTTYPNIQKSMAAGSPSFPSGHTSDAFATATALSLSFSKWYVVAPAFLWACSVGYSRMDLGVHYPSDVLAGAFIGSASSYLCYKANRWIQKRRH